MTRPDRIPLSIKDRQFLVPETDDFIEGLYLPMTIVSICYPQPHPTMNQLQDALIRLDDKFPQHRLSYRLDLQKPQWLRVKDAERIAYLKSIVEEVKCESVSAHLSEALRINFAPLSNPVKLVLINDALCLHMYHAFGDAKQLFQLTAHLLMALCTPAAFERLSELPNHYWLPLNTLVMGQSVRILLQTVQRVRRQVAYLSRMNRKTVANPANLQASALQPTVSGTPLQNVSIALPPDRVARLLELRESLSRNIQLPLNSLLQVHFAKRIADLGFIRWPVETTTLIDLRRYFRQPELFYPGNAVGNIRISIEKADFATMCESYQAELTTQLNNAYCLSDLLPNSLLAASGDGNFRRANRQWYLKSCGVDTRFFSFTNVGRLDSMFEPVRDHLSADIQLAVPTMGCASLVLAFTMFAGQGNLTATYKPDVLSLDDIRTITDVENLGR